MNQIPAVAEFATGTFDMSELPPCALSNTTTFAATLPPRQFRAFVNTVAADDLDVRAGSPQGNGLRRVVTVEITGSGPRILDVVNSYLRFAATRH
jgi:hypothetical protein